jgi:hypothetical protein
MMWRFRLPRAPRRLGGKARERRDSSPIPDDERRRTQQQFHAWAAAVRTAMEAIQALAAEIGERDRALEDLLHGPTTPDAAAVDTVIREMRARRAKMQRIIDELPALDEMAAGGESGRPSAPLPQPAAGKARCALPSG